MIFEKNGPSSYISHLDLMHVIQRAFSRAYIPVSYTEGFNPHQYISLPLPLPTGYSSLYEIADFNIESESVPEDILPRMKNALPQGIMPIKIYRQLKPSKEIGYASYEIKLLGEDIKSEDFRKISDILDEDEIIIQKKSKNGEKTIDIKNMIKEITVNPDIEGAIINATVSANPENLNPKYISAFIKYRLPVFNNAYEFYKRVMVYDKNMNVFE